MDKIILIPIGGIGSRFKQNNYKKPKALINIFGKPLIFYLIENLIIDDKTLIYIVYNHEYSKFRFEDLLKKNFPKLNFKFYHLLNDTEGASETINISLKNLNYDYDCPILCLDSDNFYTNCDIIKLWNKKNSIYYFDDNNNQPIYSYIKLDNNNNISAFCISSGLPSCAFTSCGE